MSNNSTDREAEAILYRLRGRATNVKGNGIWIAEDCQEAADLIEHLQRRIKELEKAIEAAYAETKPERSEAGADWQPDRGEPSCTKENEQ